MRCIRKTNILFDNSGETMVEVLVAFTLLSVMLVMFSQGITWAAKAEAYAYDSRRAADQAMLDIQTRLAGGYSDSEPSMLSSVIDKLNGRIKREKITSGNHVYVYYESIQIETGP